MEITIDRNSRTPIYRQIVDRIHEMITSGALPPGFSLPPERRLADALGVNRTTVLTAYRDLKGTGLIDAHVGRGTIVAEQSSATIERSTDSSPLAWSQLFRDRASRTRDPLIRDLLELTERPDVIVLSAGLPAPEHLPHELLGELTTELVRDIGPALIQYGPTEGLSSLRRSLSRWLLTRGHRTSPADLMILSGSQQGLDLTARVFLDPGDTVVVEAPTYIGALEVFRTARVRLLEVPTDAEGMRTDVLADLLERHRPKLIYTLPTFQNPSGTVMSLERRRHLLELAIRHRVPVLEDDPYGELRYSGEPIPSLKALDRTGHVIHLSTFSKTLMPGLRIGYMIAPRPAMQQFVLAKQTIDLHSNTLGQWILDRILRNDLLEPRLAVLRKVYASRRDALETALAAHRDVDISWKSPAGGFYLWCKLPRSVERTRLVASAASAGVSFLPGWTSFAEEPDENFVRLSFSFADEKQLEEGANRFAIAVQHAASSTRKAVQQETGTPTIV
ncbi:MAG: PLP-dependent aminotransferase family protein [bacterium]|nr:PLP-dependent aminotransferase family protein [bacterium]